MAQIPNDRIHVRVSAGSRCRCRSARFALTARFIAGLALVVCAGIVPGTGSHAQGESGDVTVLLRRAESGDARAAFVLGMRYAGPDDDSRDDVEAVRWLAVAADKGLAEAQYNLGIMYANGRGVAQDPREAARWYREAAEQGLASAQYNLAALYAVGDGVARDERRAAMWFERAALQDIPEAAYNLGVLYDLGRGVEADAATAMRWYARAAERGYHPAASRLAALRAANPSLVSTSRGVLQPDSPAPAGSADEPVSASPPPGPSVDAAAAPSAVASAAPSQVPAASGAVDTRSASRWLAQFEPRHYTVQVLSHTDEVAVRRYLQEHFGDGEAGYFAFELDGTTWYSVVVGDYASYSEATAAGKRLAERLGGSEPWVRKFAIIQQAAIR